MLEGDLVWLKVIGIGLLIFANSLIVLINGAFNNASANKLVQQARDGDKGAQLAVSLMEHPLKYKITTRVLTSLFTVAGMFIAITLPYNLWITLGIYFVSLVAIGEIVALKIAISHSDKLSTKLAAIEKYIILIFTPIVALLTLISDLVLKILRQDTKVEIAKYSEEQVMSILEEGRQRGELKEEGKKMINSILAFDDELAYEIMTPRTDVFMIDLSDPQEEYMEELMKLRYSRIPVCQDEADNIIGILHIKDYLIKARTVGFENVPIKSILRKPYFVPETKNIDSLFFELQKEKQHIAILIDEYGGFSGIVTMEDIIEEVMGEIDDEYDKAEKSIYKASDNTYYVNGKVSLSDLAEESQISLQSETSETVGGFIIDLLGEIPGPDDDGREIDFENYKFTILSIKDRRIEKVKIEIVPTDPVEEKDEK